MGSAMTGHWAYQPRCKLDWLIVTHRDHWTVMGDRITGGREAGPILGGMSSERPGLSSSEWINRPCTRLRRRAGRHQGARCRTNQSRARPLDVSKPTVYASKWHISTLRSVASLSQAGARVLPVSVNHCQESAVGSAEGASGSSSTSAP